MLALFAFSTIFACRISLSPISFWSLCRQILNCRYFIHLVQKKLNVIKILKISESNAYQIFHDVQFYAI